MTKSLCTTTDGSGTEYRLIEAVDEVDNSYRLDYDRTQILFDSVESKGDEYTFYAGERTAVVVSERRFPPRLCGFLDAIAGGEA